MISSRIFKQFTISLFVYVVLVGVTHAQATRTWVSGVGDDVNPCSRTAPCKTFAGAISKTAAGGIISVLDPGGYGAVTITKSITLEADGDLGSILASGTNGVIVNGSSIAVVLRGLSIDGTGPTLGTNGVRFLSGAKLVIDRCTIQNFSNNGVDFEPSAAGQLVVNNTTISNVTGNAILVQAGAAGSAMATVNNVRVTGSGFGMQVLKGSATVKDSVFDGSFSTGVKASSSSASVPSKIILDNVIVSNGNGTAVAAQGSGGSVALANSTLFNNAVGVSTIFGVTISFGNNRVFGNTTDGAASTTVLEK